MSPRQIAIVVLAGGVAFGGAFATAKAGSDDGDGGGMPGAEQIQAPSDSPRVPAFAAPGTVPGLEAPPVAQGGATGGTAPSPAPVAPSPAPVAPSPAPPADGGGGVIVEG